MNENEREYRKLRVYAKRNYGQQSGGMFTTVDAYDFRKRFRELVRKRFYSIERHAFDDTRDDAYAPACFHYGVP